MNREELISEAEKLAPFSTKAVDEFEEKMAGNLALLNRAMENRPDLTELIGPNNLSMMKDNHANQVRFLLSIMRNFNAEMLVDTILWAFRTYRSRLFHSSYFAAQLNTWIEIFRKELSPECYRDVIQLYIWIQVNIPSFVACTDEKLAENRSKNIPD
ncbi:MAG TPA: hypothetical protein PLK12_00990 [Prolixibacteraceae bacterium]|nr:hypothetical protein [Prolixibacteraceae bacterium]